MSFFYRIREKIKLLIWDYISPIHTCFRWINMFVSLFAMGVIVYFYGFSQTTFSATFCNTVIHCSLLFYALKFCVLTVFNRHSRAYLKKHKVEGIILLFILLWFFVVYLLKMDISLPIFSNMQLRHFNHLTIVSVQLYFFILVLMELPNLNHLLDKFRLGPGGILILSFLLLITIGTVVLLLPEMTVKPISVVDALFTATSASCITGLTTLNTATDFTLRGQLVILLLIQLGGLNIICFATYFTSFYKGGNLRQQSILKEMFNTNLSGSKKLTKEIILYTFIIELIGFFCMFLYLVSTHVYSTQLKQNFWLSLFHTIVSFNNAGFSTINGGTQNALFINNFYLQIVTIILAFLGGIGFLTLHDIINALTTRKHQRFWTKIPIRSKIVLKLSFLLLITGALLFFLLEYHHTLAGESLSKKIMSSFFMSIACRSIGFTVVDVGRCCVSTLIIMLILMSIGTSAGSTGGGIKLSTFYILIKSAWATIKGKKQVTIYNRSVSYELVDKSYVVLIFTLFICLLGSFILSLTDPQFSFMEILFEIVSSCGTVGLSMGITPLLSPIGKITLIVIMYIGRITILTLAISIARRAFNRYTLVKTNLDL